VNGIFVERGATSAEPGAMSAAASRTNNLARLAVAALVLTFVVVVASATMRHAQSVGCADWPSCYGRVVPEAQAAASSAGIHVARLVHRLAASAALLAILTLLVLTRGRSDLARARTLALAALAVALALAVLGIATPGATLAAVPLGNLLGGFLMIALLAALAGSLASDARFVAAPMSSGLRAFALALLAALFVQTLAGALIGTQFALPACPTLNGCGAGGDIASALDPFREPVVVEGRVVPPPGASALHVAHRALGLALAVTVLCFARVLRHRTTRGALLLAALAVASPLTGVLAILDMPSAIATVVHNALAAASIAALAYSAAACRRNQKTMR
jgi:cytochrome c oxidase assembly protein subunit 15